MGVRVQQSQPGRKTSNGPRAGFQVNPDTMARVRSEYAEMPGLSLSGHQARRLWNLDAATCDAILQALEEARFLKRLPNGCYVRADVGC